MSDHLARWASRLWRGQVLADQRAARHPLARGRARHSAVECDTCGADRWHVYRRADGPLILFCATKACAGQRLIRP